MDKITSAFSKLLDRQPSQDELKRLVALKDLLQVQDNDAIWYILIALDSYNSLYKQYPKQINEEISEHINKVKFIIEDMVNLEANKTINSLTEKLTSDILTSISKSVETSRFLTMSWWFLGFTLFGSFCLFLGYILGSGNIPFWVNNQLPTSFEILIITGIAKAPSGLIVGIACSIMSISSLYRIKKYHNNHINKLLLMTGSIALLVISIILFLTFFL